MPQPLSERQSLKAELAEIPRQIAAYWERAGEWLSAPDSARAAGMDDSGAGTAASRRAGEAVSDSDQVSMNREAVRVNFVRTALMPAA
jgi:hypothetical protein